MPLTRDSLISAFHDAGRPRSTFLVGAELERHLLLPDGTPLPYFGQVSVASLLARLRDEHGWSPYLEGENIIALKKDGAWVTLEPGGQFELSGAPYASVQEVDAEARGFATLIDSLLAETDVAQSALGLTPFASIPDIPWVPKGRYKIMREHLGKTGKLAHHMMKGTCATQASYDFENEEDCAQMVRLATLMGPITTALFANSPWLLGKPTGYMSYRGHIWTQTDPARTGLPDAAEHFTFERWVDYLLASPMMFIKRQGDWRAANGLTFATWMTEADPPGDAEWELHQTSVFPEVRVKATIVVRGADCVPIELASAFAALFEGLFYDLKARGQALEVMERYASIGTKEERFDLACRKGLAGQHGNQRLADIAAELVELSGDGLARFRPQDAPLLVPLRRLVHTGMSLAQHHLNVLGPEPSASDLLQSTGLFATFEG